MPDGAGVRAVRRAEGVVDVDVAVGRELRRELGVVRLLLGVEAQVLEQQQLARAHAVDRVRRSRARCASPVTGTGRPMQLGQALRRPAAGAAQSVTLPLGRPRWLMSTIEAPRSSR